MGITRIPLSELEDDRAASIADIKLCEWALSHGHQYFGVGDGKRYIRERLDINREIVEIIDAELKRREKPEDERTLRTGSNKNDEANGPDESELCDF